MTDKQLQDKAIDIHGKNYVLVSDRIIYFNEIYKNGCIKTALVSQPSDDRVVIKAQIVPDIATPDRYFTGYSQATWGDGNVNKTAALENAETSAVGRALAMLGIGVIDSVASVDEMKKAGVNTQKDNLTAHCEIHDVEMQQGISKKTGNAYWYHKNEAGDFCFGKGYQTR